MGSVAGGLGCWAYVSSWSGVLVALMLLDGERGVSDECGIMNAPVPMIFITPPTTTPTPPPYPHASA